MQLNANIEINIPIGDDNHHLARIKVVLDSPWQFTESSTASVDKDARYDAIGDGDPRK